MVLSCKFYLKRCEVPVPNQRDIQVHYEIIVISSDVGCHCPKGGLRWNTWTYLLCSAISRLVISSCPGICQYLVRPADIEQPSSVRLNGSIFNCSMVPTGSFLLVGGTSSALGCTRCTGANWKWRIWYHCPSNPVESPLSEGQTWFLQTNIANRRLSEHTPHMYICSGSAKPWYLQCFGTLQPQKL